MWLPCFGDPVYYAPPLPTVVATGRSVIPYLQQARESLTRDVSSVPLNPIPKSRISAVHTGDYVSNLLSQISLTDRAAEWAEQNSIPMQVDCVSNSLQEGSSESGSAVVGPSCDLFSSSTDDFSHILPSARTNTTFQESCDDRAFNGT